VNKKRARKKTDPSGKTPSEAPVELAEPVPEVSIPTLPPEELEAQEMTRQLTVVCMELIIKVATCRCEVKRQCAVYQKSQEIAELVDKLQELRRRGSKSG